MNLLVLWPEGQQMPFGTSGQQLKRQAVQFTQGRTIWITTCLFGDIHVEVPCSLFHEYVVCKTKADGALLVPLHANHLGVSCCLFRAYWKTFLYWLEMMLSLTLGHLNQKIFLEQPCCFRTKEDWEVLKSWINSNVFVWPVAAWALYGREYSRSFVLHFCPGSTSGVGGTLWVLSVGKGNGLCPLLLTVAVLSVLCVYLGESQHLKCVYSLTQCLA